VRRDTESVLAQYDIADKAMLRQQLGVILRLDYLEGRYDDALKTAARIRELEEKPADKLLSGVTIRALINAERKVGNRTSDAYRAAHKVDKPDIWAARDVTLPPDKEGKPVNIAIWDSGVDTALFPGKIVKQSDGKPAVSAFDKYANPATGELQPIPAELRNKVP